MKFCFLLLLGIFFSSGCRSTDRSGSNTNTSKGNSMEHPVGVPRGSTANTCDHPTELRPYVLVPKPGRSCTDTIQRLNISSALQCPTAIYLRLDCDDLEQLRVYECVETIDREDSQGGQESDELVCPQIYEPVCYLGPQGDLREQYSNSCAASQCRREQFVEQGSCDSF